MLDSCISAWLRLPVWGRFATAIFGLFAISSIGPAIHERSPVAFIESFLALTFHWALVLGSFASAIWGGVKVAEKLARNWIGWVVGTAIFITFGFVYVIFEQLPGIGWRMESVRNSNCYVDWDGRTNPTVCD
ncbi:hypothetical protein [Rhizobium viscosum]|uniref:Uncharacterized protein n=1 Tax=Rhizobium viscosum TaxID=1673 RepID=A0ABR9ITI8_RHIVS|nr:hypothetical protein [Rhizobium viscosum]MBE1506519.1 hypothetical protein [Rhizobium viscosum]